MLLIIVFNLISLAKGLLEGSGAFSDGVLSQVTWEDELDGSLDVAAGDGVLSLVSVKFGSLQSDSLEEITNERVHDTHGLLADASFWVDVLEDSVDVDSVRVESLSSASGLLWSSLLGWGLSSHFAFV